MKVLSVSSFKSVYPGNVAPFIKEQADALEKAGIEISWYLIQDSYFKCIFPYFKKIKNFQPDLVHAHYGLSGLLANLQRKVPVITTYHGCDINRRDLRLISVFTILLSKFNVFVSSRQVALVKPFLSDFEVIPCGINLSDFIHLTKSEARKKMGLDPDKRYVLFSSDFARPEKNASLAIEACSYLENVELLELKGYSREEMVTLMNAVDVGLLTSVREGSPMFVKEMIACRRPVVSTDVGDVSQLISDIPGCYIVPDDPKLIAQKVKECFDHPVIDVPVDKLNRIDNKLIAKRLVEVYHKVARNRK